MRAKFKKTIPKLFGKTPQLMILFLLLMFFGITLNAQTWFPIGAKWYFNDARDYFDSENEEYYRIVNCNEYKVSKDTVVNGLAAKLIEKTRYYYGGTSNIADSIILRENNGKIYYYDYATFFPDKEPQYPTKDNFFIGKRM